MSAKTHMILVCIHAAVIWFMVGVLLWGIRDQGKILRKQDEFLKRWKEKR